MSLTDNDQRLLREVQRAQREWDGYAPHGAADWKAARRLIDVGLLARMGMGECETCPERHPAALVELTDAGRWVLEALETA